MDKATQPFSTSCVGLLVGTFIVMLCLPSFLLFCVRIFRIADNLLKPALYQFLLLN